MMQVTAGSTLQNGKYVLNQMLHQIGPEITYKATQVNLNQAVVIKTLQPNPQTPVDVAVVTPPFLEAVRRFVQCHHPHLVRILDGLKEKDQPFIVLEYIAGQSFAERIQARGPFSEERAIAYVRQLGEALGVMHSKGLIHSNVNPAAILRRPKTHSVVLAGIEFLAILNQQSVPQEAQPKRSETDAYVALEQVQPSTPMTQPTITTDIYGLAATLYYLVTGQAPSPAVEREQGTPLATPRQLQPGISSKLEAAILNGMQIHAQYRPQTMADWLALLPTPGSVAEPVSSTAVAPAPKPVEMVSISTPVEPVATNGATPVAAKSQSLKADLEDQSTRVVAKSPVIAKPPKKAVATVNSGSRRLKQALILTGAIAASAGLGIGLALRFGGSSMPGSSLFHTEQAFPRYPDWPGEGDSATVPEVNGSLRVPEAAVPAAPIPPIPPMPTSIVPKTRPVMPTEVPVQPTPEVSSEPVEPPALTSGQPEVQPPAATQPSPPDNSEPAPLEPPPPPALPPPPAPATQPAAGTSSAPASNPSASEPQP